MVKRSQKRVVKDAVHIRMDICVDLPAELADEVERVGICQFDKCIYENDSRQMTASVNTTFYRVGGSR